MGEIPRRPPTRPSPHAASNEEIDGAPHAAHYTTRCATDEHPPLPRSPLLPLVVSCCHHVRKARNGPGTLHHEERETTASVRDGAAVGDDGPLAPRRSHFDDDAAPRRRRRRRRREGGNRALFHLHGFSRPHFRVALHFPPSPHYRSAPYSSHATPASRSSRYSLPFASASGRTLFCSHRAAPTVGNRLSQKWRWGRCCHSHSLHSHFAVTNAKDGNAAAVHSMPHFGCGSVEYRGCFAIAIASWHASWWRRRDAHGRGREGWGWCRADDRTTLWIAAYRDVGGGHFFSPVVHPEDAFHCHGDLFLGDSVASKGPSARADSRVRDDPRK